MKKSFIQKIIPHVIAILIFILIAVVYSSPILEGKRLQMGDITNWQGMSKEIVDFRNNTGEEPLWTNSMFGGMPAYLISMETPGNLLKYVSSFLNFMARPASFIFIYLLGFYIALLLFGLNPWLGIIGSIAFAFSSYNFIIIEAGHASKAMAIGYLPPIIAGIWYTFRKNIWIGGAVTALFLGLQLLVNHLQITYYTMLIVIVFGVFELVRVIRNKQFTPFIRAAAVLIVAAVLAVGSNLTNIWTTLEYGQYSMRGKSELTHDQQNKTSGLDRDYITAWSYGVPETMTLLIPDFRGGSSHGGLTTNSETYKVLKNGNVPNARQIIKQLPLYYGQQPFTSGPVYVGAIVFFLFIFGLFFVKGNVKWWLLAATILSIFLAWGKNFNWFTNLFLDYFPGYNKFRTVSMTLVIAQFTMPLLGFLAVKKIFDGDYEKSELLKTLKYTFYVVGGFCLLVIIAPSMFASFSSPSDTQMGWPDMLIKALHADREQLLRSDALRSFIFVTLAAALIWAVVSEKIKTHVAMAALAALVLVDMWPVDKRYLNNDDFVNKRKVETPYTPNQADQVILQDKDSDFRVLDLASNTFNSSRASYFHFSIGGYHGAKMRRYQDLIDFHITREMQGIIHTLQSKPDNRAIDSTLASQDVLNMLNTRYIIYNPQAPPLRNNYALGNAWFIDSVRWVPDADREIQALYQINPANIAVVDQRFADEISGKVNIPDSTSQITLKSYQPNDLVYEYNAPKEQVAVFSEIYYPKGWEAYVDGKPHPIFRADYILRAMQLPAGSHKVEFKFHPTSYYTGNKVSMASSALLLIGLILIFGFNIFQRNKKEE